MNTTRRLLLLLALLGLPLSLLSAKGTQEKDFQQAEGKDNFSQKVDLTNLKPGQYNLLVRTRDAAGNVAYVGPFNFYYDPNSDNPLMTVANPSPGQRIPGSLNIVGVASAPKGMAKVEVQFNGGDWGPAKGKAFWSWFFNANGLPDGNYSVGVRGTDVNGVVGPVTTVPFVLDQQPPALNLTSVLSGERVQGTIKIEGDISDGNGVRSADLSTDGRKTLVPLALQGDEKAKTRRFATTLDTTKFPDGPQVLWVHAVDGQGSESKKAVLLLVDNTPPSVKVLYPPPNQGLHGKVRFALLAEQAGVGLRSLTAWVGDRKNSTDIAVVPGDPFRFVDLDLPLKGSGTVNVGFDAVDIAGKTGSVVYVAKLDNDTDLPKLSLIVPLDKAVVKAPYQVSGLLQATDGPGAVEWSLNGGPPQSEPSGAAFNFTLNGLVTGTNKLQLTPVDKNGKKGPPQAFLFTAVLGAPQVKVDTVVSGTASTPFAPALKVAPDQKVRLSGTASWENPVKTFTFTLGQLKSQVVTPNGTGKAATFQVSLPDDPPFGVVPFDVSITDIYDQTTAFRSWLDISNLSRPQGPDGLAFVDPRLDTKPLVITPETPLRGSFQGGKIKTAELITPKGTVPASVVAVSHDDQSVTLTDLKDGQFDGVKLRLVTDKNRVYETDLGSVIGDTAAPTIALSSPLSGAWVRENLKVEGKVNDQNGIARLEWSIDNGKTWGALDPPSNVSGTFSRTFNLPGPDNFVNLLIRATDPAGRSGTVLTVVRRDTTAPEIELSLPTLTAGATGKVYVAGRLRDEGALQKAEVTVNKKLVSLPLDRPFVLTLDAETAANNPLQFRVSDWAGNVAEKNFSFPPPEQPAAPADPAAASPAPASPAAGTPAAPAAPAAGPKPQIQILFPTPDLKGLNGTVPVVGRVLNFSSAPALTVTGEGAPAGGATLSAAGFFTFDVDLGALKSRGLTFSAAGEAKEAATLSVTLPYDAASALPVARFLAQAEKPVLTGYATASGWIGDSRGTVTWTSQLDKDDVKTVVPDPAKGPVGTFLVDLGELAPGPHRLTVVPYNGAGKAGTPAVTEFVVTRPSGPVKFTNLELGQALAVAKDSRLQGTVFSINTWRRLEIRFADLAQPDPWNGPFTALDAKKGADGMWSFDVPLPATLPYSRIGVAVRGEDSLGQKVEGRTLFYRIWLKDASEITDTEGLIFEDQRLDRSTGRVELAPGEALTGAFRGRPLKTLTFSPPQPNLTASFDGSVVTVAAKAEGLYGPFTLTATTIDNETFPAGPLTLFSDAGGPQLDWDLPANGDYLRDAIPLKGKVADPSTVTALEVSFDQGRVWTPVPVKAGAFDARVPAAGADGPVQVQLRATDKGGHTTLLQRAVIKDGNAPTWSIVAPPTGRTVNGLTTIIGTATDFNPVASVEYSDDGKTFKVADGTNLFAFDLDFASYAKLPDKFYIRTTDAAGNQAVLPLVIPLDQEADKPVVQVQTPAEGEVVRADFAISGVALDDDGLKSVAWRIDANAWQTLETAVSFSIPISLSTLADNEHTIEIQATDIYGTKGNVFKTGFKVSLDNPGALLVSPEIDKTASGNVTLSGASFDRNGIDGVQISLDNGLTWNKADLRPKEMFLPGSSYDEAKTFTPAQRAEWEWRFDSRILKDGTYLVMVKSTDKYGGEGLFTTLVNLDNTAPTLTLTTPNDGLQVLDTLDLAGRSADNIKMVTLKAELRPIESPAAGAKAAAATPAAALTTDLPVTPTFNFKWALGTLAPGWYNLRLEAKDGAGNATYVARNIKVEGSSVDRINLMYPQQGEKVSGSFLLEGKVVSRNKVPAAVVTIDGTQRVDATVDEQGYFSVPIDATLLEKGPHTFQVSSQLTSVTLLNSEPRTLLFDPSGPWVKVTSHKTGAYVSQRPFILGQAGWTVAPLEPGATPEQLTAYKKAQEDHKVVLVEASLDNGKTFSPAQGTDTFKFRLESLGLPDGPQPLFFRAHFQDGTIATQRMTVLVAQTPPSVQLLTPIENGRFNGTLDLAGFSTGDGQVSAVEVAVRQGDKAGYEVPSFIQGMYLDTHFWGATYWETGLGLTFFQQAVKLQGQIGQAPFGRFWGTVAGAKLIASLAQLPAGFFFGPDWSWLSSSVGVGAQFSNFSMNGTFMNFTATTPVFLGGIVIQWEVARAALKDLLFFNSYGWYNEATAWFISSDVQAQTVWAFSTGLRIGLF